MSDDDSTRGRAPVAVPRLRLALLTEALAGALGGAVQLEVEDGLRAVVRSCPTVVAPPAPGVRSQPA